jgi:hypothetical protein
MKTKLVTAFYTDIIGFPFFGHESFDRHDRYLHSLRTLNNMNTEIVCYCNETQREILKKYFEEYDLNNITLKISNLKDYPRTERMIEIKKSTGQFNFYHEVDWNKLYLLSKEYDESCDYIYWIDCGLSHRGLFLLKYNPYPDNITGLSRDWENYSFTNLFCPELFPKINNWVGDKLINLSNTMLSHSASELNRIYNDNHDFKHMTVGGILGGHISKIKWFIGEFDRIANLCLNNNFILNHEAMMTKIHFENSDMFKTYKFNTWYHDDFWLTTPVFDRESIKNMIHFVHFFEKELGI